MFLDGKTYEVKRYTSLFGLALAEWIDGQIPYVQFLVDHLVDEPFAVTEENRKSVLRQIELGLTDPQRADIVSEVYRRRWEKKHAEATHEQPE